MDVGRELKAMVVGSKRQVGNMQEKRKKRRELLCVQAVLEA